jgi:hypothetical protein
VHVNNTTVIHRVNSTGTDTTTVVVALGSQVQLGGTLTTHARAGGVALSGSSNGTIAVDMMAAFDVAPLTPGVTLVSCSGATYNQLAARATSVASSCGAAPPVLAANVPALGGTCTADLSSAPSGAAVLRGLLAGAPVATTIGACVLHLDPASAVFDFAGTATVAGQLAMSLAIPNAVTLLGFALTAQALTAQALPLQTNGPLLGFAEWSNGVLLQLGF